MLWFWLLVLLIVLALLAWPTWPYTRERGFYARGGSWPYVPSAFAIMLAVLLLILFWFGFIIIWWPWVPY